MTTPTAETPARSPRFGQKYGCLAVVSFLAVLGASVVYAVRQPLPGVGTVAVVLALGFGFMRLAARREREEDAREVARLRSISLPHGNAWRALLAHEGLARLTASAGERVRPAVRLVTRPAAGELARGQSRIGGAPDLPRDVAWPEHGGLPMMFLAELELAAVARAVPGLPLPATGHLWFFYALAQPWGFDPKDAGASRVLYRPGGVELEPRAAPQGLPDEARFEPCALSLEAYEDLPDLDEDPAADELDDDEAERYIEIRSFLASGGDGPSHKLLGHADPIQSPMELECQLVTNGIYCGDPSGYEDARVPALRAGAAEWRLLLQLDSDDRAKMMWGDAGRLYFWIRESDLRELRFERAWLILQCG